MDVFASTIDCVNTAAPEAPVFCYRPHALRSAAAWFLDAFPGDPYFAVKANPAPHILMGLWDAGVRCFDVASDQEVKAVSALLPEATLAFMHPVKNRAAISAAYFAHGVRSFVLDSSAELEKICEATGHAADLTLIVRVGVSNDGATVPLTGKFGASEAQAPRLLRHTRRVARRLGVSFHVGSQSLAPAAWSLAMAGLSRLIAAAAVTVDVVDVGGGFPARYAARVDLEAYRARVASAFGAMMVTEPAELWSEPGRALVAEAESLLVRVDGVKPGALYLNDGGFGALYDAVHLGWDFQVRALRPGGGLPEAHAPYALFGPTCDSADRWPHAIMLPQGLKEGDYLEFGAMGAYGRAMATGFNGFGSYDLVQVADSPFPSAYTPCARAGTSSARTVSYP
ncbi:MAG: type III PLP-dependent enzyme [Pseudomonadota bacterium]